MAGRPTKDPGIKRKRLTLVLNPETEAAIKREGRLKCVPYGYVVDDWYNQRLGGGPVGKSAAAPKRDQVVTLEGNQETDFPF